CPLGWSRARSGEPWSAGGHPAPRGPSPPSPDSAPARERDAPPADWPASPAPEPGLRAAVRGPQPLHEGCRGARPRARWPDQAGFGQWFGWGASFLAMLERVIRTISGAEPCWAATTTRTSPSGERTSDWTLNGINKRTEPVPSASDQAAENSLSRSAQGFILHRSITRQH